ncbi:MAG: phosphotransferase [Bacteroidales bacterium]|nr:phosphotransferase [Candidatus Colimorpha merdihippi]
MTDSTQLVEASILSLFLHWAHQPAAIVAPLAANGSNRRYWRLASNDFKCIAAFNDDVRENEAFIYYSRTLLAKGIRVPEVYAVSDDRRIYLQQDLGDTTLYNYLYDRRRNGGGFDSNVLALYEQVLTDLAHIQLAGRDMDFSFAYPRAEFDRQSMQWDLNYFKYYFLKLKYIPFDEQLLERDFQTLIDYLLSADCNYFLYRDFQSRNIMLHESQPYYIDFQGGRRGAAQYDVASLLYSAKSDFPEPIRQYLLSHYIRTLSHLQPIDQHQFLNHFYAYVLIRIMQAMGAYGYRGYFERKDYFLQSIPLAVNNLRLVIENHPLPISLSHLEQVWQRIVQSQLSQSEQPTPQHLTVTVGSFSYKKGLPVDSSGNGGGFIFDCRALPNPGRYEAYRQFTGKDLPVIEFLRDDPAVEQFLAHIQSVVGASVSKYLERNFTSLMVYFGCTGGQHRSVYCAERLAKWLSDNYDCQVIMKHREQD